MDAEVTRPDYAAIKQRQKAIWASGNYAVVGTTLQVVGETLCEALDVSAGERVLDVAAGNGNATMAAARRFADVTSTDFVGSLLNQAKLRAAAEGLTVDFEEADAEELPYPDGSFDVALSTFGIMFTPEPERAAAEISRVVRSGGRIGLANWTPGSFVGQLFKIVGSHVPPPRGLLSPALWGTEARLLELFRGHEVRAAVRTFNFRYRSPEHWLEIFRTCYGPTHRAFAALDETGQAALARDVMALVGRMRRSGSRSLVIPSEYLEVVIERR